MMQTKLLTTEGFYSVKYSGVAGWGEGMLTLDTGIITGSDIVGGKYDGTYSYNPRNESFDIDLKVTVPAGAWLVMGVPSQATDYDFRIQTTLRRDFADSKPVTLNTPFGPVLVVFQKLRDFP